MRWFEQMYNLAVGKEEKEEKNSEVSDDAINTIVDRVIEKLASSVDDPDGDADDSDGDADDSDGGNSK